MAIELTGSIHGTVRSHSPESLAASWQNGVLITAVSGKAQEITVKEAQNLTPKPVVLFMHGSSGVNPQIREFATWLAESFDITCVMPDSMQLKDRITYSSPVSRQDYEDVHRMRLDELNNAMQQLKDAPWFDGRVVIAGTSEGGVCVARFNREQSSLKEQGRMIFSWSCENNYHVSEHASCIPDDLPVLNVMSATDKFFSKANSYLDCDDALGYAGNVLKNNTVSTIALIPNAPHTLFNLPHCRDVIEGFLKRNLLSL